ncbi:MAG: hypothetical protein AB7F23_02250 [Phycisphaerae bacterium]|jgi:protein involved in sex pheromone biosynthesis
MKKSILALLLISSVLLVSGCGAGVGTTADERYRSYQNINNIGNRQLNDDINMFLHTDQPSRLTDKYVR